MLLIGVGVVSRVRVIPRVLVSVLLVLVLPSRKRGPGRIVIVVIRAAVGVRVGACPVRPVLSFAPVARVDGSVSVGNCGVSGCVSE